MAGHGGRGAAGAALVLATVVAGCAPGLPGSAGPAGPASSAASRAARDADGAFAGAGAEAERGIAAAGGAVDARNEVRLGAVTLDGDGRAATRVVVRNTAGSAKSFAVQVDFTDRAGNLLDVAVVLIGNVAPRSTGQGTARGNHRLHGGVRAAVGTTLRY
ncbi:hypothetical protein SAMN04490357_1616 [Streptomyces misionensis]|uniref:Uncharacterized protein n=1 Tax=Streptomyces misionensis TaxID=67331 RepID=A0A1H4R793_9ACTN|nr:hypothetical protein [Streptomyces misionensis]SEC27790.1 hypothetical protein SAMN04490357_1616 [Streptomyces misionensis]